MFRRRRSFRRGRSFGRRSFGRRSFGRRKSYARPMIRGYRY